MTSTAFLDSIASRIETSISRMEALQPWLTPENLNAHPDAKTWCPGQIIEHMNMSVEAYLPQLQSILGAAPRSDHDLEVRHTWIGKQIIKASGPAGNVPVPGKLQPTSKTFDSAGVVQWFKLHRELVDLARASVGADVSKVPFKNPIIKVIRMNSADALDVLASHAERHVGQIEARARG